MMILKKLAKIAAGLTTFLTLIMFNTELQAKPELIAVSIVGGCYGGIDPTVGCKADVATLGASKSKYTWNTANTPRTNFASHELGTEKLLPIQQISLISLIPTISLLKESTINYLIVPFVLNKVNAAQLKLEKVDSKIISELLDLAKNYPNSFALKIFSNKGKSSTWTQEYTLLLKNTPSADGIIAVNVDKDGTLTLPRITAKPIVIKPTI